MIPNRSPGIDVKQAGEFMALGYRGVPDCTYKYKIPIIQIPIEGGRMNKII